MLPTGGDDGLKARFPTASWWLLPHQCSLSMDNVAGRQGGRSRMRHIVMAILLTTAFLLLNQTSFGQPANSGGQPSRLTLDQAIRTALENHPLLHSSEFAVQSAEARVKQAESPYYPQVAGAGIQTNGSLRSNAFLRPSGSLIQPNQSDMTVGVTASQLIYDFGQTKYRVESQRADRARIEKEAVARRADVILVVQRSYLAVLKRKRLVQIADETVRERDT